jgi:uncharacterized protein YegJ (DUF2314 family)
MSNTRYEDPTLERDGWELVSAEVRNAAHPDTFQIPTRDKRMSLVRGDAVKLLFHIESTEDGRMIERGVDRMWVIVKAAWDGRYVGVLDNDPGEAEGLLLHLGDEIVFGAEHVAAIERPPRDYIVGKYGPEFLGE